MPEDNVFCQLVATMTTALNSQAKASFSGAALLQQVPCELFVSHLLGCTLTSVKQVLLSTLSTSALLDEVILRSLTHVKDDSQLSLLKNLSSLKGGKQSTSTASSSV